MLPVTSATPLARRTNELYDIHRLAVLRSTDRLFAYLMICQYVGGIVAALLLSPRTWAGASSSVHPHVWAALVLGAAIAALPVTMAFLLPGRFITRMVIASGQMLASALLIHLSGGRIETHFHVFGSLAFLAFYRDWRVFIPATVVVGLDHLIRGIYWPESVYGVLSATPWRSLEHALWVLFEDVFLIRACVMGVREMRAVAENRARLEMTNARIEDEVCARTEELRQQKSILEQEVTERARAQQSLAEMNMALANAMPGISQLDPGGRYMAVNDEYAGMIGYQPAELLGLTWERTVHPDDRAEAVASYERMLQTGIAEFEARAVRKDGSSFYKHVLMVRITAADGQVTGHHCFMRDISERKHAEAEREELHRRLLETSRLAGMAEVATGVLHNVGNVLNSVNVSTNLVAEKVRQSKATDVALIANMLKNRGDLGAFLVNDERGRLIPKYLTELGAHLLHERTAVLGELQSLVKNVEHITDIVRMQQTYARVSGVVEAVLLSELLEDAVRINSAALVRHHVRVARDYQDVPRIQLEKQKVLQILVNLINNAKYAMDDGGASDRVMTLRLHALPEKGCARIVVSDNGVGIPAENLTGIFSHGFTTRQHGHGFGLHSCSLAAKAMGGSLGVQSDGHGKGATFTLDLPLGGPPQHERGTVREKSAHPDR